MSEHAPLILDVAGLELSAADRRRLAHPLTGGVILFTRNWEDRSQLESLCAEIKAVREDLLICVDHEGGRVQRFRTDGFTHLPPMRTLGALWMRDAMQATAAATACGYVLAAELRACGVDFSFTPVLDLDWQHDAGGTAAAEGSRSSVIGDRAFHGDARVAALLAKSLMHGLLQAGMACCGKHFPGHGFVQADSHTDVPVDRRAKRAILDHDAKPYQWLAASLHSVMPAHVVYPRVDARPAGFSSRWLQDILRGELGFTGAIFSDDLSMQGARYLDGQALSFTQAAVAALNAGCDLVLVCNQSLGDGQALDTLLADLTEARHHGHWRASTASAQRREALLPAAPAASWDALMASSAYLQALDLLP